MDNRVVLITFRDPQRGAEALDFYKRWNAWNQVTSHHISQNGTLAVHDVSIALQELARATPLPASIWVIDESVAGDWISFQALINEVEQEEPDLAFHRGDYQPANGQILPAPFLVIGAAIISDWKGRDDLKDDLVRELHSFIEGTSLTRSLDLQEHRTMSRHFRAEAEPLEKPGIRWTCVDPRAKAAIFSRYSDLGTRVGHEVSRYSGDKWRRWFAGDVERWRLWFHSPKSIKLLQVGDVDGIGICVLLTSVFPNPESEAHIITDSHEPAPNIEANARAADKLSRITAYEGSNVEVLAWMICEDGFWEEFDFIIVNCTGSPQSLLSSSCQAWHLLRPGGTMVFDCTSQVPGEQNPLKTTVESFLLTFGSFAELKFAGEQIVIRKSRSVPNPGDLHESGHQQTVAN